MGFINVIIDKKEYKVDEDTDFIYLNDKKIGMYDWDEGDIILDDTTSEEDSSSEEEEEDPGGMSKFNITPDSDSDTDSVPSDYDSDEYSYIKGSIGWKKEKEAKIKEKEAKKKEKEGGETKEKEEKELELADFDYDDPVITKAVPNYLKSIPPVDEDDTTDSDEDDDNEEQELFEKITAMTPTERVEYFIQNPGGGLWDWKDANAEKMAYSGTKELQRAVWLGITYASDDSKNYDPMKHFFIMKDMLKDRFELPPHTEEFARIYKIKEDVKWAYAPIKFLMNLRKWNFMEDMPEWMVKRDWIQGKYDEMISGQYVIPFINTSDPMADYVDKDTDDDTTSSEESSEEGEFGSEEEDLATKYKKDHPDDVPYKYKVDTSTSEEEEEEIVPKDKGISKKAHSDAIKKLIEGEGELIFEVVGDPGYSPGFKYKV